MSSPSSSPSRASSDGSGQPRWHEYPIGVGGELATAITRTLLPFLIGIAGTFLLCLAVGLAAEEGALPTGLNETFDQLARYTMVPVMVLSWTAGLSACIASTAGDVLVSRAVLRARRAPRADRRAVPPPHQVLRLDRDPGHAFLLWTVAHLAVFGLLVVIGFFVALADPEPDVWLFLLIVLAVLAVFAGGAQYIRKVLRPAHRSRFSEVARFWVGAEQAAWGRAPQRRRAAHGDGERTTLIRTGAGLTHAGVVLLAVSALVLNGLLFLTHPQAGRYPGGDAGPRADLPEELEQVADQGTILFGVLIIAGLLAVLLGVVVEALGHAQEKAYLRARLAEADAERPTDALLRRYSERHTPRLAQAAAALGGAALCLGWSGIGLGGSAEDFADVYRGVAEIFADLRPIFTGLALGGGGLVVLAFVIIAATGAGGRDLRNELNARWPVRPKVDTSDRKNPPPAALRKPVMGRPQQERRRSRQDRNTPRWTSSADRALSRARRSWPHPGLFGTFLDFSG